VKRLPARVILLLGIAASAQAADNLLLGGTDQSSLGSYSYLGALVPIGQGQLGDGWVMRQWFDRLTYRYNGSVPDIRAEAYGYAPAIGYQWPVGDGSNHAGLYAGLRVVHTQLSPDDLSNVDRGTHARFSLQGELTSQLGAMVQNQFLAQGEFGNGAYFVRDRLAWRVFGHYTFGPEAIAKGSSVYQAREAGLFFGGIALTSRMNLLVRGGVNQQPGEPTVGDFSVEMSASF
jgi:hypothetical protein